MKPLPPCPRCSSRSSRIPVLGDGRAFGGAKDGTFARGSFRRKHDRRRIRRFGCRRCGRSFSESTGSETFGQHRPDVNEPVERHLVSLVSQRRTARLLRVNRKTVETVGHRIFDYGAVETTLQDATLLADGTALALIVVKDGGGAGQTTYALLKLFP